MRDIASTPQAMPTSMVPAAIMSCDEVGALLAGAALRVDRGAAGVLREAGVQPGAADHVVGLLTGLGDAAADDLLDEVGVDAGALEHLALREPEEYGGVHAREPALPLAEGGADGVDDHGGAHGAKLEHVLVRHKRPASRRRITKTPHETLSQESESM